MAKKLVNELSPPQISFEDALKRLEAIVRLLEEGDVGLNEALQRYEEGVKLLRQSYELLQRAERQIELLSGVDAEGNPITQTFDDTATFDQDQSAKGRSRRRSSTGNPSLGKSSDGWEVEGQTGDDGVDES
jgi:exodeoxyribonuclease VII small subunit